MRKYDPVPTQYSAIRALIGRPRKPYPRTKNYDYLAHNQSYDSFKSF